MSLPIIICDDSTFAQKALARSLPDEWDVSISYAGNGQEAIDKVEKGLGDLIFLDLNMPIMDGYETLKVIREYDLPTMVIVVSGDVQPEARQRVKAMGAIDFIEKPIDNAKLLPILHKYGIYDGKGTSKQRQHENKTANTAFDKLDVFREMCNVAMGKAGQNLAQLLNTFVELPIPSVNLVHSNELAMAIAEVDRNASVSAVSKGFVSQGFRGEAIIMFNDAQVKSINTLLGYPPAEDVVEIETLMDISNIIVGACLAGLAKQLQLDITHNTPIVLGMHCDLEELVNRNVCRWDELVMVEISYAVSSAHINFDLLLLLPKDCLDRAFNILTQQGAD